MRKQGGVEVKGICYTDKDIKEFEKNVIRNKDALVKAQAEYLVAKVYNDKINEIDYAARKAVLDREPFYVDIEWGDEAGERITTPSRDYLMPDKEFKKYLDLRHAERTKRGLKIPSAELSSDYESYKKLRESEDKLLETFINQIEPKNLRKNLGLDRIMLPEHREALLDLAMRLKI